ncbi:MAG: L,D-transpeptidase [Candidatus Aminicenantes bacterium]|nr:L,D-transpeptidase [Candidatus Aminicenantes bacterium]
MEVRATKVTFVLLLIATIACREAPVLPEAEAAKKVEQRLWEAGASIFIPMEYEIFRNSLRIARIREIHEKNRFFLFRKLDGIKAEYQRILAQGEKLLQIIEERREEKETALFSSLQEVENLLSRLRVICLSINESQRIRQRITGAEVLIAVAQQKIAKKKYQEAEQSLFLARQQAASARQIVIRLFERYVDENYLNLWQKLAQETITDSKREKSLAIIVDKLERKLILYSGGEIKSIYNVGLGRFSLADKIHAGDEATPEGKYKIIKKIPTSKYYKALLLNYPNEDDWRRFAEMKKRGLIPPQVGIGGLIEIHGGGQDGLTHGCIAMENEAIDELFRIVEVGTPVTIVGTLKRDSLILKLVKEL